MLFPDMLTVSQIFPDHRIPDVSAAVLEQMEGFPLTGLQRGDSIAIAVGSRGIANLPVIVRAVIDFWKMKGFRPFIFPSMGSHGGATAEGQREELAKYDITESMMSCPIKVSMEVIPTGRTPDGVETFMDRNAYESAAAFLINRIKWHTDFGGTIESGLVKMIAIGLGKDMGAIRCHKRAYKGDGLGQAIKTVARHLLSTNKILGGLAILEDANNNTAKVVAIPSENMEQQEEKLLVLVKSWKGNIPFDLDVLIVNKIGKNISGPGMDTKVINRNFVTGARNAWKGVGAPWIGQIFVRGLHPLSRGNAMGIGMADVLHDRALDAMDIEKTRKNAITAQSPGALNVTLFHYPTDRQCLETIMEFTECENPLDVRIGWINNTLELNRFAFSKNLEPSIRDNPSLEIIAEARPFTFDKQGQFLWTPFPA